MAKVYYTAMQALRALQDTYADLAADVFDGRDPRPPRRKQFIQPVPAKPGMQAPSLDEQREIVQGWYDMSWYDRKQRGARDRYCDSKGIADRTTLWRYERNCKAAGIAIKKGRR